MNTYRSLYVLSCPTEQDCCILQSVLWQTQILCGQTGGLLRLIVNRSCNDICSKAKSSTTTTKSPSLPTVDHRASQYSRSENAMCRHASYNSMASHCSCCLHCENTELNRQVRSALKHCTEQHVKSSVCVCSRLHDAAGRLLLQLLHCKGNCQAVLAGQQAVPLVQRLATVLDTYIEKADQSLGKRCQALETLLQVRPHNTALANIVRHAGPTQTYRWSIKKSCSNYRRYAHKSAHNLIENWFPCHISRCNNEQSFALCISHVTQDCTSETYILCNQTGEHEKQVIPTLHLAEDYYKYQWPSFES